MFRPKIFNAHDELHYVHGHLLRVRSAKKQKPNVTIIDPVLDAKKMVMKVLVGPKVEDRRSESHMRAYFHSSRRVLK